MNIRALPGTTKMYMDFIEGASSIQPILARHPDIESIKTSAREVRANALPQQKLCNVLEQETSKFGWQDPAIRNVRRLVEQQAVIIMTSCRVGFAGGSLDQFLKCLTSAKLAAELEATGIPAFPLCWIHENQNVEKTEQLPCLLDSEAKLHRLKFREGTGLEPLAIEQALRQIEELLGPAAEPESLELLRRCYSAGADETRASGSFLAALMKEWGIVFVDGRNQELLELARSAPARDRINSGEQPSIFSLQESFMRDAEYQHSPADRAIREAVPSGLAVSLMVESVMPVAARVVDQADIFELTLAPAPMDSGRLRTPRLWPRASATLLDSRSRKILDKYNLAFSDLTGGTEGVIRKLAHDSLAHNVEHRLEQLEGQIEMRMGELRGSIPSGESMALALDDSLARMTYQVRKLREKFAGAIRSRREILGRQIERLGNSLLPEGCLQETKLAGLYFVMRYSPAILRILFEELDVLNDEHQLIPVE